VFIAGAYSVVMGQVMVPGYAPIVGAVTPTSFVVAMRAPFASKVMVQYKTAADADYLKSVIVTPRASDDWTIRIPIGQLKPWTVYDYRIVVDGRVAGRYETRTFPGAASAQDVNIGLLADHDSLTAVKNPGKPLDVYRTVLAMRPDSLQQVGDFPHWNPAVYPAKVATIANWRLMHQTILAEAFPAGLSTWTPPLDQDPDDHDSAKQDASLATKPDWRAMMIQAHDETFPSYLRPSPGEGLWQEYRIGRHVHVIKLDVRSQKDPKESIERPGHSMLGTTQKAWFEHTLLTSDATWKVIVTTLPWQLSIPKADGWFGYQLEHAELEAFIQARGIRNVIFVSGDNHCGFLDDGTHSGFPEINVPGTNTVGACTSGFAGYGSHGVISDPVHLPAGAFAWINVTTSGRLTARLIRADGVVLFTMALLPQ